MTQSRSPGETIASTARPAEVRRTLRDPRNRVPEASDAPGLGAMRRFRANASRFRNGAVHERRRARILDLLDGLDPAGLAVAARRETARMPDEMVASAARRVPALVLAERLGFGDPERAPALVARVAGAYADDGIDERADAAAAALCADAPAVDGPDDDIERALRVQVLVQAHLATAALVERAAALARSRPDASTRALIVEVLRNDPPVAATRRIVDGAAATLPLADPDGTGNGLAFGDGPRACPAPHHALAIAGALVDELRGRPC